MPKFGRLALWRRNLRDASMEMRRLYLTRFWGMHIEPGCAISFSARLDKTHPDGIYIGKDSAVVFGAAILAHDTTRRVHLQTRIGERCNIGAHAIIMPGVTIGDGSVVAMGSVVMRDVPPGCIAFGNPARILETGIVTEKWGVIVSRETTANKIGADKTEKVVLSVPQKTEA